jgi:tetratricopeptide (TPR) repeat protein
MDNGNSYGCEMRNRTKRKTIILFAVLVWAVGQAISRPQSLPEWADSIVYRADVERVFVDAMKMFTAEKFDTAATMFHSLMRMYPRSHRETGAMIMGAKALAYAGKWKESIRQAKDLIDVYPTSLYIDDAHYTLGLDYYQLNRYEDAGNEFLIAREMTTDLRLQERAERLLDDLASTRLSLTELQSIFPEARSDAMKALLNLRTAERIFRGGDVRAARDLLESVAKMHSSIPYVADALALLEQTKKSATVKVGVVLPLQLKSGKAGVRNIGSEFLDGIRLAV